MIDTDTTAATAEDEGHQDPFADMRTAGAWIDLIKDAQQAFEFYHDKCDGISKQYADLKRMAEGTVDREMQVFWANLEVLKPSIYARAPIPVVTSRFKSRKPIPRAAAEVLERALISAADRKKLHDAMKHVRDDLALTARGALWPRYETAAEGDEYICFDHKNRRDFLHEPARKWEEVGWVAGRSWLTTEKGRQRFGDAWLSVKMEKRKNLNADEYKGERVGEVWEIWHKDKNAVVWVCPDMDPLGDVLDIQPPFLALEGFFPCPKPAYGTVQSETLIPVPDFVYYRDQLEEINTLTARIGKLTEALRLKGFYAAGSADLADSIETVVRSQEDSAILVPVSNFAAMGAASLKDSIVWLPVTEISAVIKDLIELRKQLFEDVYQITGLSDIMRGSTNPNETLGAQELKSQYGNVRIRDRQEEMIRVARDALRIAGEIMAENFQPQTLMDMSQVDDLPMQAELDQQIKAAQQQVEQIQQQAMMAQQDPAMMEQTQADPEQAQGMIEQGKAAIEQAMQQIEKLNGAASVEKVIQLLREQRLRPFILDIETDSTIQPDEMADKQARTEFLTAVGGFLNQAAPMVTARPETGQFAAEMLKFTANGFRAGRAMDSAIDEFADQLKALGSQPKGPDPAQVQAESDAAKLEAEKEMHAEEMDVKRMELSMREKEAPELRAHELNKERLKAGIPPDYANDDPVRQMLTGISEQNAQTAKALEGVMMGMQAMAEAFMAPKMTELVTDEFGKPRGSVTRMAVQ